METEGSSETFVNGPVYQTTQGHIAVIWKEIRIGHVFSKSKYAKKQRRLTFCAFVLCGLYKEIKILGYNFPRIIFWFR